MREYDVDFFIKENGDCPVKEFLLSLDKKMRAKLLVELDLLEENGPQLREPYSKHLEDGIFELRAKQGSDITRVLYFFFVGKKIFFDIWISGSFFFQLKLCHFLFDKWIQIVIRKFSHD